MTTVAAARDEPLRVWPALWDGLRQQRWLIMVFSLATFAGQWGPQTNSPFNAGCSETQWSDRCVQFGSAYYRWERCVRGCTPPMRK